MIEPTIQPIGVEMLKENCDVVLGLSLIHI